MRIEKTVEVDICLDDVLDQMSDDEFDSIIYNTDTGTLIKALRRKKLCNEQIKDLVKIAGINCTDIVRNKFEGSPAAALEVLQDMLGMQHTTTKEQVIEQLKQTL